MTIIRAALVGLVALVAAACLPVTSKNPVGSTATLGSDPALVGTWKGRAEGEQADVYFHFLPRKDGPMTALLVTDGWMSFSVRTATLGANQYINARELLNDGTVVNDEGARAEIPVLYRLGRNGTLTLYLMDEKAVGEAIKAGKIEGTVGSGDYGDVQITAGPQELDAFMTSPGATKLFPKPFIVLRKEK